MKIIVGLGNPDKEYENTFHNLGFMCVDALAKKLGVSITKSKCKALIGETKVEGEKVIIAKPQTYMNLSGDSVGELMAFYKTDLKDLLVLYDDFDLVKGNLRIRESGSAGTHNGMKSIVARLNSEKFTRLRVGFKDPDNSRIPLINLVLSGIRENDRELYGKAIDNASNACIDFINGKNIDFLMQKYNGKKD